MKALAIDIGGTSVKYAYVSSKGEISNKNSFDTYNMTSLEAFLTEIRRIVEIGIIQGIRKIGISSLGIFDTEGMCVGGVENLPFLEGVNLRREICSWNEEIQCSIMNDGTAAAMGEYWLGEAKECQNFICITLGTGIGGAIVIGGNPVLGSHFQSGEVGYYNYVSEMDYMERSYSTKGILEEAARRMNLSQIDGFTFVEYVKNGDAICSALFQEWMHVLGSMLANYSLLLDPEKIILGGGISGQKEWICDALTQSMQQHLPTPFRGKIQVYPAKYGNDAGILGSVEVFFNKI